jgi:hypothetical protein
MVNSEWWMVGGGATAERSKGGSVTRQIELVFPECDKVLAARLYEEQAPVSCEAIWRWLEQPREETLRHAWPTLPEMWFWVPPMPELPYENATVFPRAGDLLLYHYDQVGGNYTSPTGRVMAFDIGIYYAQGYSLLKRGWIGGNLIGAIAEVKQLAPVIARQMIQGTQKLIVRRGAAKETISEPRA